MLADYEKQVRQLKGIAFDAATQDVFVDILPSCKEFSQALDNLKIDHTFEVFAGEHADRFADRCQTVILPFFLTCCSLDRTPQSLRWQPRRN